MPIGYAVRRGRGEKQARRVLRGGSWINNARNCRSANRNANDPGNRDDNIGFRLARAHRDVSEEPQEAQSRVRSAQVAMSGERSVPASVRK